MIQQETAVQIEKVNIRCVNHLANILKISGEKLVSLAASPNASYSPFDYIRAPRPFQKEPASHPRRIDNPFKDLSWAQKRINRRLLAPICFPHHICGAIRKRSVLDNAEHHHGASLLVTIDVKQCFPSITNKHVYRIWRELLGCEPPVASLLTRLTTFNRHLPQGAATSPLLANLFIWMIDEPIRSACHERHVIYSTWIDDLAFSGERARELIQIAAETLRAKGLRVSRQKIEIMGPTAAKLITGTRLSAGGTRVPRQKLSRIRSGIHKFECGMVAANEAGKYIKGLVAQLRFVHQLCPKDAVRYAAALGKTTSGRFLSDADRKFLTAASALERVARCPA
jgi:RNA-directed DNA polymerase